MKRLSAIFALLALWVSVPVIARSQSSSILEMEQLLEAKIAPILQRVDPGALFFIRVYPKREQAPLPLTPFVLDQLALEGATNQLVVEKIEIRIFTAHDKLTPAAATLLKDLLAPYGHATIIEKPLPGDLLSENDRKITSEEPLITWEHLREWTRRQIADYALEWLAGIFAFVSFFLMGFLGHLWRARQTNSLIQAVGTGVDRLSSALETRPTTATPAAASSAPRELATYGAGARVAGDASFLASLPVDSLCALLADCYWSNHDAYAAFLWQNFSPAQRQAILEKLEFAESYSYYISGLPAEDYRADQEPCFLSPMPIHHLDNRVLTEQIRKQPGLLYRISSLRRSALSLAPTERVTLTRTALGKPLAVLPDFSKLPSSPKRELKRMLPVPIRNTDEETEILKLTNLTTDLKQGILTLGWLAQLPAEQVQSILKPFSARELAEAWIGPEAVLTKLEAAVPESKLKLIRSYLQKIAPSRQSPCFLALHRLSLESQARANGGGPEKTTSLAS